MPDVAEGGTHELFQVAGYSGNATAEHVSVRLLRGPFDERLKTGDEDYNFGPQETLQEDEQVFEAEVW